MAELPVLVRLPISHYCRKVEWALAHAGIPFAARDVWFRQLLDLRDLHPGGTVPVLVADDARWCGSQAIMEWVDARTPRAALYPSDAVRAWELWADETIGPLARRDAYKTIYEHPTRYSRNPLVWALARAARPQVLGVLKHIKARRDYAHDDDIRDAVLTRVGDQLRAAGTPFLFGDAPTAADFSTAALLAPMMPLRRHPVAAHADRQLLGDYVKRVRPSRHALRRVRRGRRRLDDAERKGFAALPVGGSDPTSFDRASPSPTAG